MPAKQNNKQDAVPSRETSYTLPLELEVDALCRPLAKEHQGRGPRTGKEGMGVPRALRRISIVRIAEGATEAHIVDLGRLSPPPEEVRDQPTRDGP